MKKLLRKLLILVLFSVSLLINCCHEAAGPVRTTMDFDDAWRFSLNVADDLYNTGYDDSNWRVLDLPHDWSIEGTFSKDNPAGVRGGALPGGIGWYRKTFSVSKDQQGKPAYIEFDGVYQNSSVWLNGHFLGRRPYGYISFRYQLNPYLHYGDSLNLIAVKVDNSQQPNSRWYSGSGIYRNVRLLFTSPVCVDQWGTFVRTPEVSDSLASIRISTRVMNISGRDEKVKLVTTVYDPMGRKAGDIVSDDMIPDDSAKVFIQHVEVNDPQLWSVKDPSLYTLVSEVNYRNRKSDRYETRFGIRYYNFDPQQGFLLNGKHLKIRGVCNHHDLGPLGTAVNIRALERQLDLLKEMGCNSIRTSHNPPAPELLDLCDEKGFLVMDEAFDMWKMGKTKYDYHLYWDEWHKRDLSDFIRRDRNHPSVIIWSIGNEIREQRDSSGTPIAKELSGIVKSLDPTRPVTSACNFPEPGNFIIRSGALDLIGYNYHQQQYPEFPATYPGERFIASETTSALATRGHYDMPSDSIRRWPVRGEDVDDWGNPGNTCSSYDNCSAPWGSTHEETLGVIEKYDFLSGMYVWTGFDYLGEPTPYEWPSRSSYFGILDLCGFPKDAYYLYQSQWTSKPVLHLFPHWNHTRGDSVDIWAYTNCDSAQLTLNGLPLGTRVMGEEDMHLRWREAWNPGILVCQGFRNGKVILSDTISTAGEAGRIVLVPDRDTLLAGADDLAFVTVRIEDNNGNLVPHAGNLVHFTISGQGSVAAVGNGDETSHESFRALQRHAFNGLCLAVVKAGNNAGDIRLTAESDGLESAAISLKVRNVNIK